MYQETSLCPNNPYFNRSQKKKSPFYRLMTIQKADSQTLFDFNHPVQLNPHSGLGVLVVTKNPDDLSSYKYYVLRNKIEIAADVYFNILTLTDQCVVGLDPGKQSAAKTIQIDHTIHIQTYSREIEINQFYGAMFQISNQPASSDVRKQYYYELFITNQGQTHHTIDQRHIITKENQALLLYPDQTVQQEIGGNSTHSYVSFLFDADFMPDNLKNRLLYLNHQQVNWVQDIIQLLQNDQVTDKDYHSDQINALFYILITSLLSTLNQPAQVESTPSSMRQNYENEQFQEIVDYLRENIGERNEVSDLVDRFDISRSTLQSLFKRHTQKTPKEYINHLRLEHSKYLIRNSQLSLSEIADQLGFGSIQYFSRAFKREYGINPSSYSKSLFK